MFTYTSIAELVEAAEKSGKKISELVLADQAESMEQRPEELFDKMSTDLDVMADAVKFGEKKDQRSTSGLTGGEGWKMNDYAARTQGGLSGTIIDHAIARALSMEPELLVADEPIASLDVSIQAQIINLFRHLQQEHGFSILFIAHDLAMVEFLCDRVGVMYHGKLVELADTTELYEHPLHPYTKILLSAIPIPDPIAERKKVRPDYSAMKFDTEGQLVEVAPGHFVLQKGGGDVSEEK